MEITPADADTSTSATGHQVDLAGGKTAVTVTVTAEDGTTTKDYTVNFHRPVVPHDWSLRPEGVSTGESFRVLIVTSTTRNAQSGDIADYDAHVRSALANRGHADIEDYGPLFQALAGTEGGAAPPQPHRHRPRRRPERGDLVAERAQGRRRLRRLLRRLLGPLQPDADREGRDEDLH